VFGPPTSRRTNGDPKLLRQNPLKARDPFAAAGWKTPPTAGCAMPRAIRSRSST
jgi:hypothetical protein